MSKVSKKTIDVPITEVNALFRMAHLDILSTWNGQVVAAVEAHDRPERREGEYGPTLAFMIDESRDLIAECRESLADLFDQLGEPPSYEVLLQGVDAITLDPLQAVALGILTGLVESVTLMASAVAMERDERRQLVDVVAELHRRRMEFQVDAIDAAHQALAVYPLNAPVGRPHGITLQHDRAGRPVLRCEYLERHD